MAENIPNTPTGAVPPKPAEAAKVQPKKETVRINLPPKPTSSPTIKIPTPAAVAPAPPAPAVSVAAAPVAAPAPAAAPAQRVTAAPTSIPSAAPRPTAAPRPAAMISGISGLDKGLAIAAAIVCIAVLVRLFLLGQSS